MILLFSVILVSCQRFTAIKHISQPRKSIRNFLCVCPAPLLSLMAKYCKKQEKKERKTSCGKPVRFPCLQGPFLLCSPSGLLCTYFFVCVPRSREHEKGMPFILTKGSSSSRKQRKALFPSCFKNIKDKKCSTNAGPRRSAFSERRARNPAHSLYFWPDITFFFSSPSLLLFKSGRRQPLGSSQALLSIFSVPS